MTQPNLIQEQLAPGVRVLRFVRPDLRRQLDSIVDDDNVLFREVVGLLEDMEPGERLIFNFGLVERFPTTFFQLMMRLRQRLTGRSGQMYLCCFRPEILPAVVLMGGSRLFRLTTSEEAAFHEAKSAT